MIDVGLDWLLPAAAMLFVVCELLSPAALFFVPLAVGSVAGLVALSVGASNTDALVLSVVVAVLSFALLWPLGRRLDRGRLGFVPVGADRWTGRTTTVTEAIEPGDHGQVRLDRELWRAKSLTGFRMERGTSAMIVWMSGTTAVVVPASTTSGFTPLTRKRRWMAREKGAS